MTDAGDVAAQRPRKMRRMRRSNVDGGRVGSFHVRVTPEERLQLLQKATGLGISVPRLMIESALHDRPGGSADRRDLIAELFALHRLLANVANNMNQIARAANIDGVVAVAELSSTVRLARNVIDRLDDALDGLVERDS